MGYLIIFMLFSSEIVVPDLLCLADIFGSVLFELREIGHALASGVNLGCGTPAYVKHL